MTPDAPETPKVSVIMPVYNSCEYVEDAARSVLSQDLDSFELLLVDDGSTDGSAGICDRLAAADERVRVFHIPNGGMCHARNLALREARGTYVAYCDNDDEFLPGLLSENYELAQANDVDCVRFGRRMETYFGDASRPEATDAVPAAQVLIGHDELAARMDELCFGSWGVWNGLYRRSFLVRNGIRFNEDLRRGNEDALFNIDVFSAANAVCLNPEVYYVWRRRADHSSTFMFDDNYFVGYGLFLHRMSQFADECGLWSASPDVCRRLMLSPFREMVGSEARVLDAGAKEDMLFCAKVRAVYEGIWTPDLQDLSMPQSIVLTWVMRGNYHMATVAIGLWRSRQAVAASRCATASGHASLPVHDVRIAQDARTAAGIVTYNPDLQTLKSCVESVMGQVDEVLLYDNGSQNEADVATMLDGYPTVSLTAAGENRGLAVGLNALVRQARLDGAQAILLLDQDTCATDGIVREEVSQLGGDVALVCPQVYDRNAEDEFKLFQDSRIEDITFGITAGSMLSCEAHESVGGYDERFFVDLVDHELCFHLRHDGWRVVRDKAATLLQELGKKDYAFSLPRIKQGKFVMLPYYRSNHAMFRRRDMGRSFALLLDKYRGTPQYVELCKMLAITIVRSLLVERRGITVLRNMWDGYLEGRSVAREDAGNSPLRQG